MRLIKLISDSGKKLDSTEGKSSVNWRAVYAQLVHNDFIRVVMALVLSFLVLYLSTKLFPKEMNFYWKQVFGLIIAAMFLAILDNAMNNKVGLDSAVKIALLMFFIFRVSYHYFDNQQDSGVNIGRSAVDKAPAQVSVLPDAPDSVFTTGVYYCSVKGLTPFNIVIKASHKGCGMYSLASSQYTYKILFSDGEEVNGNPYGTLRYREYPKFRLYSPYGELVKLTVN
jgi:hypothetical protein